MINIDYVLDKPEVLHVGADWERLYTVIGKNEDFTLDDASAVCKIRDTKDNPLCTAFCSISGTEILVQIGYQEKIGRAHV